MKAREYDIMVRAVEEGVDSGIYAAFEHYDEAASIDGDVALARIIAVISDSVLHSINKQFKIEGND
tara:strand:+ start:3539 stop:3736 length:198 start_codon:yes stop_codon:yes gene_type:complete